MRTLVILVFGALLGATAFGVTLRNSPAVQQVVLQQGDCCKVPVKCECQKCKCETCKCENCVCEKAGCKPEVKCENQKCCDKHE